MSQPVELDHVTMRFGDSVAVRDACLRIEGGEFFSVLGPSGCGKTTVLRLVSGFMEPSEGAIRIGGQDMRGIGPNKRPTALIFQSLALFPLMSVAENVGFGLEVRGVATAERRARVKALLELVALPEMADQPVGALSGGQRQRVAIARALAVEPAVLLLDEPLSALDLKLRQHMRAELKAIQRRTKVTFIYITHDQGEALTMSDRIAVMSRGRIEQVGTPEQVYGTPATAFVASFVGESNKLRGKVAERQDGPAGGLVAVDCGAGRIWARGDLAPHGLALGDAAIVFVRPECMRPDRNGGNAVAVKPLRRDFEGPFVNLFCESPFGDLQLQLPAGTDAGIEAASFAPEDAVALPDGELARD
jgi:spermidine/putrescine transport system ATP-binding protein